MALKNNTWKINQWYDQSVAGNVSYSGAAALFTWGINENGQLGQNEGGNPAPKYSSPVQIPGTTWAFLANGTNGDDKFMMATKTDGTLWGWGGSNSGSLGLNAESVDQSSPTQIPGTTWGQQIKREGKRTFAIKTDGTMWSWGYNSAYGALGHNNKTQYSSPIQIPGSTWANLDTMGSACLTTKTDGTLWVWGAGSHGMLAQNNLTAYSSPKQVPGTTWNSGKLSGGGQHAAAIKTDGTLWMWGVNEYGMLGQNSLVKYSSPIQIPGSWSEVGCNHRGISAIKTDGTLWVWGSNMDGRLGLNQAEVPGALGRSSPTQIPGTTWNKVVGGLQNNMATKTDGTLWMWGPNSYGSLGQNNIVAYSSPVQVAGSWNTGDGKISHLYFGAAAIANI